MKFGESIPIIASLIFLTACDLLASNTVDQANDSLLPLEVGDQTMLMVEIVPGLSMRIFKEGAGNTAENGQIAVVHYTGWLYDETAKNNRGYKFDSSVDRDQYFSFMLGARRVIQGWDRGVVGMKVGETRELTISPDMAYGERGAGNVIAPGAMLVFEIELVALQDMEPVTLE